MKSFALFPAMVLLALLPAAGRATPIAPGVDLSLVNGTTNESFTEVSPGTFTFSDGLSSVTAVYVATPLGDTFSVTDACVSVGSVAPCKQYALSITDANFAQASLAAGVSTYAATQTVLSGDKATVNLNGNLALGSDTLLFTAAPVTNNPVPEPASLGLMVSGILGASGIVRRRWRA